MSKVYSYSNSKSNDETLEPENSKMNYESDFHAKRKEELETMKANGLNPYPYKFNETRTLARLVGITSEYVNSYGDKKGFDMTKSINYDEFKSNGFIEPNSYVEKKESIIARVSLARIASKKLHFFTVQYDGCTMQLLLNLMFYDDKEGFKNIAYDIKRGDIIGAEGYPGRSKTGEFSLYVTKIIRLTPCLHDLPSSHFGIKNNEVRARMRCLDLIVNSESRTPFIIKTKLIKEIRKYLDDKDFMEVHTPILSSQVGGAIAKPFVTYHNDLKMDMYMRIAPELFLKQLVVGGFSRVYEIGQQFRNESMDQTHDPQFMSMEFYMVGADYMDLMQMSEDLMSSIVLKIKGSYKFIYNEKEIDFTPPWRRLDIMTELNNGLNKFGIKLLEDLKDIDLSSPSAKDIFDQICIRVGVDCSAPRTTSRLLDKLIGRFVESQCYNPTFVINHPLIMSPLAKPHRDQSHFMKQLTERFEIFVLGTEYGNGYTELNDPQIQCQTFTSQMEEKAQGNDEAQEIDHTFIKALEFGLPPTGGFGMGIERFVMLLSDKNNIQDTIFFPTLRTI